MVAFGRGMCAHTSAGMRAGVLAGMRWRAPETWPQSLHTPRTVGAMWKEWASMSAPAEETKYRRRTWLSERGTHRSRSTSARLKSSVGVPVLSTQYSVRNIIVYGRRALYSQYRKQSIASTSHLMKTSTTRELDHHPGQIQNNYKELIRREQGWIGCK